MHWVSVITIKPGFIKTKMTSHLDLPKLLTASTSNFKDILNSIKKGKALFTQSGSGSGLC